MQPRPRILTLVTLDADAVEAAAADLALTLVADTLDRTDVLRELCFEHEDGTLVRLLEEPDLGIPVVVVDGPSADSLRASIADRVAHVGALAAALAYDASADASVRLTALRMSCAHALEAVTDPMRYVAARAALDPSPFVRLEVIRLFRYAMDEAMAVVVERLADTDADPDVRALAGEVLRDHWLPED